MGNLTNKQKRSLAQVLFCKENLTIQETAERVGISRQTVGKWAKEDKWEEQIYTAMEKVLDEKQWAKYLKTGAAREKKARDKRAAKR